MRLGESSEEEKRVVVVTTNAGICFEDCSLDIADDAPKDADLTGMVGDIEDTESLDVDMRAVRLREEIDEWRRRYSPLRGAGAWRRLLPRTKIRPSAE